MSTTRDSDRDRATPELPIDTPGLRLAAPAAAALIGRHLADAGRGAVPVPGTPLACVFLNAARDGGGPASAELERCRRRLLAGGFAVLARGWCPAGRTHATLAARPHPPGGTPDPEGEAADAFACAWHAAADAAVPAPTAAPTAGFIAAAAADRERRRELARAACRRDGGACLAAVACDALRPPRRRPG